MKVYAHFDGGLITDHLGTTEHSCGHQHIEPRVSQL